MAYTSVWIDERPQILAIVNRVKEQFPAAWNELKIPGQESRQFINRVSMALIEAGIPGGVNLKRGGPQQSIDALAFPNPTGARDASGTYKGVEIIDIVNGAEGSNPSIGWGDVTQVTMDSGNPGGWKAGSLSGETPGVHLPSYAELGDDVFFRAMIGVPLFADYLMANQSPNDGMSVWFSRAIYRLMAAFINANGKPVDAAGEVKIVRNEWRGLLGLPPL